MAPRACPGSAIAGWIVRGIRIRSRSGRSACAPACPANANRIATCSCRTTNGVSIALVPVAQVVGSHHVGLPVRAISTPAALRNLPAATARWYRIDFALRAWEAHGCGRLVVAGAELAAIRQRLDVRAAAEALAA